MEKFTQEALDFLKDIIIIVVIVLVVRTFFVMPFQINGASMMDSYYDKQFILVDRLTHRDIPVIGKLQSMDRGDVVVFKPWVSQERKYFIKRVIGQPGESVKIENGRVYIKELGSQEYYELDESGYLNEENNQKTYVRGVIPSESQVFEVPENMYFVLGDNRNQSTDSRTCFANCATRGHFINQEELTGRIFMDLGYFNFGSFSFQNPELDRENTKPQFFSSPANFQY